MSAFDDFVGAVKRNPKRSALIAGGVLFGLATLYFLSEAVVTIPPDKIGVEIKKFGKEPPENEVIAPDSSYAGVQLEVLKPGWRFINPFTTDVKLFPNQKVPPGHVGVLVAKWGQLPEDPNAILVDKGERGYQKELLQPGIYPINPEAYAVEITEAIQVPEGRFAVVSRKVGEDPEDPTDILVSEGERGFQRKMLRAGTYFLHPYEVKVEIVDPYVVPEGHVGIVTSFTGEVVDADLVEKDQRGVWKALLRPGTHPDLNPKGYEVEIKEAINVPDGHVGVVTSLTGERIDADLVEEGQRGVWRKVLRPGLYYEFAHSKAYSVEVAPAVKIEAGYVGVVVARTDGAQVPEGLAVQPVKDEVRDHRRVVQAGKRGIQPYTLPPGLHYLNPYEFTVISVDSRRQKYEMSGHDKTRMEGEIEGDDRLTFPSRDGFEIKIDTSIEWQIMPGYIPQVVADIGNTREIIEKIIRPNAREIGRLEGSKLKAEEFIVGDKREDFVRAFSDTLKQRCEEKHILIHKALVREVFPPQEVAKPLKEREVALLMQATNDEKMRQAQSEAQLAEEQAKIEQRKQLIGAETEKKVAETEAQREKEVATIKAEQLKAVAEVEKEQQSLILEKQKLEAQGIRELAEAEAAKAKALIEADGALDKKLKAWTEVMKVWAGNPNLVPRVVVGAGGNGENGGGLTGQELILQLLAIERLDRFVNDSSLELGKRDGDK